MSEYKGLTTEICEKAFHKIIAPMIKIAAENGAIKAFRGTIVVMNLGTLDDYLFVQRVNPDAPDAEKYDTIAINKAATSARTGRSTRELQQFVPHLLKKGNTKWGGSTVRDGLVVAFSGLSQEEDEMVAEMMASAIIADCRSQMTTLMEEPEADFVGD